MIIYSIYKFVNQKTGKCYIGYTENPEKRLQQHKNYNKKRNKLYNAIQKYGFESFDFQIIYQSKDPVYTKNTMESFFIDEYNSYKKGYNSTLGGEGAKGPKSKSAKIKMSKSRNSKFPAKDIYGNTYQITKDDIRYISGELVGIQKGSKASEKTLEKYKIQRAGNKNRLGITHSEADKKKIRESMSKLPEGICPNCGKKGKIYILKRNHFDKCKVRSDYANT